MRRRRATTISTSTTRTKRRRRTTTRSEDSSTVVAFSLGSNLGDREANLVAGIAALTRHLIQPRVSSPYATSPRDYTDQPAFLNAGLIAASQLGPEDLVGLAKAIERTAGRQPGARFAPRLLDIDLLIFGETCLPGPPLTLPHPRLREREFVLAPLAEIAPDLSIPPDGTTVDELLRPIAGTQGVVQQVWSLHSRKLIP